MRKIVIRSFAMLLIVVGILFFFNKPIKTYIVNRTSDQYAIAEVTKEKLEENKEKPASFDFEKVKAISTPAIAKSQTSGKSKNLPVIASIAIPSVGIHLPIFNGLSNEGLLYGAGTMTADQEMGKGNYALASHRSDIPELLFTPLENTNIGDRIYLTDLECVYTYEIISIKNITPEHTEVIDPVEGKELVTLVTCGDLYATTRIIVQGELLEEVPMEKMSETAAKAFDLPVQSY